MGRIIDRPDWAREMTRAPRVTAYAGAALSAVPWYGADTRKRVQVTLGDTVLDLDIAQAAVLADMLDEAVR